MKNNVKFFSIVLVLLLASSIVLSGCMYAIAAENGDAKVYDMGSQISSGSNVIIGDDTPIAQTDLQKKFWYMYDISEDGKSITVISKQYLEEYWQNNYEKEEIRSLSIEEVYFIIQDSIRIYFEYDQVELLAFEPFSNDPETRNRIPTVKEKLIITKSLKTESIYYHEEDMVAIYSIILYRLMALSSPEAFFTGAEAIRFVGDDPNLISSRYPETKFYIPDYSEDTVREDVLKAMGSNNDSGNLQREVELFAITPNKIPTISFWPQDTNVETKVYPTVEMDEEYSGVYSTTSKDAFFELRKDGFCYFIINNDAHNPIQGTCLRMQNKLSIMIHDVNTQKNHLYVFHYKEGKGYSYSLSESTPIQTMNFEDGTMFYFDISK